MSITTTGSTINTIQQFDSAPLGTVVQGRFGVRVKTRMGENGEGWTYAESNQENDLSTLDHYTVLYAPAVEVEDIEDPIGDLAKKLWEIRNEALVDSYYSLPSEFPSTWHEITYRAIAEYVLTEFGSSEPALPSKVLDNDGSTWTLRENGLYSISDDMDGWSSFEQIESIEGIRSVVK